MDRGSRECGGGGGPREIGGVGRTIIGSLRNALAALAGHGIWRHRVDGGTAGTSSWAPSATSTEGTSRGAPNGATSSTKLVAYARQFRAMVPRGPIPWPLGMRILCRPFGVISISTQLTKCLSAASLWRYERGARVSGAIAIASKGAGQAKRTSGVKCFWRSL